MIRSVLTGTCDKGDGVNVRYENNTPVPVATPSKI